MKKMAWFMGGWLLGWRVSAATILVLCALEQDVVQINKAADYTIRTVKNGQRTAPCLSLAGHDVYVARMGAGLVESAVTAEALISHVHPDLVLTVGVAGALCDDLAPGSWVRITDFVAYQKGSFNESGFAAQGARAEVLPAECVVADPLPTGWQTCRLVRAASGEAFMASTAGREHLRDETGADVVEMNLAGIAAACRNHEVQQIHYRQISDRADPSAAADFLRFSKHYDGQGGTWAVEFIRRLKTDRRDPQAHPALEKLLSSGP